MVFSPKARTQKRVLNFGRTFLTIIPIENTYSILYENTSFKSFFFSNILIQIDSIRYFNYFYNFCWFSYFEFI